MVCGNGNNKFLGKISMFKHLGLMLSFGIIGHVHAASTIANKHAELMYAQQRAEYHKDSPEEPKSWLSSWSGSDIPEYEGKTLKDLYQEYTKEVGKSKENPCTFEQMLAKAKKKACVVKDPEVAVAFEKTLNREQRGFLERHASWKAVTGVAVVGALAGLYVLAHITGVPVHNLIYIGSQDAEFYDLGKTGL